MQIRVNIDIFITNIILHVNKNVKEQCQFWCGHDIRRTIITNNIITNMNSIIAVILNVCKTKLFR